ncbi:hypothetical protein LK533_06095 [Sphingomonas sp. PL-96]|uniref:hypothetical protein n=1 Tax=Sphingomonas sp. PL-96 TaxID=2887201 RepID=UPI001E49C6AC|nr:hypothetical protein [Sphingomonas sp. PL-96]MCC2976244.1 hypothetical protein [Sphingomonas sp. PL-96]
MKQNQTYSTLFSCLHDEKEPIGYLGRGTHYSVFRSIEWLDVERRQLVKPQIHDFAVIWDEDHDERIINVVERIYMAGLLSPVQFIGERKGGLSIVLAARYYCGSGDDYRGAEFAKLVSPIVSDVDGDSWNLELGCFDRHDTSARGHQTELPSIIQDKDEVAFTYLKNIDNLWRLGTKEWNAAPASIDLARLAPRPSLFGTSPETV